jgi:uncharacterized protein (DUF1800 family)
MLDPYIASHRFGLSETSVQSLASDPQGWVIGQVKQPHELSSDGLMPSHTAWALYREVREAANSKNSAANDDVRTKDKSRQALQQANQRALAARWNHAIATPTPVAERWARFWANHFCVSGTRAQVAPLVWSYEREAIRPHVWGSFAGLARAATLHPAMLLYLDNAQSVGPDSEAGRRRERGLNENLGRELLELHTLGVNGGYSQADVTEAARILTGWTLSQASDGKTHFVARTHQPGSKRVMGKTHPEGPSGIDKLLASLAQHPATARHLATKLVRHFVTDQPPAALVAAVENRFLETDGNLTETALALFRHPLAWDASHPPKFKTPEELLLSAHRVLKLPIDNAAQRLNALTDMGQPLGRAPSPQGWPDQRSEWLSPQALMQRVKWADGFSRQKAGLGDARALAQLVSGSHLSDNTRTEIDRAESNAQAMALWLASPEFQRR